MTHLQKWKKEHYKYTYQDIAYGLLIHGYPSDPTDAEIKKIFWGKTMPSGLMICSLQKLTGLSRAQILNEE